MKKLSTCLVLIAYLFTTPAFAMGTKDGGGGNSIDDVMVESTAKSITDLPESTYVFDLKAKLSKELSNNQHLVRGWYCIKNPVLQKNREIGLRFPNLLDEETLRLYDPTRRQPNTQYEEIDWTKDPVLVKAVNDTNMCVMGVFFDYIFKNSSMLFYFSKRPLDKIVKDDLGIPFDSDQTAVQTDNDVFIDEAKFNAMNDENRKTLILHEVVMFNIRQINKELTANLRLTQTEIHSTTRYLTYMLNQVASKKITLVQLKKILGERMRTDTALARIYE
jgi:hypothetical protein